MNLHAWRGTHRCPCVHRSANTFEYPRDTRTLLDGPVYQELAGHEARGHHHTRAKTGKQTPETSLLCESAKAIEYWALGPMTLVYLREQRVRGL